MTVSGGDWSVVSQIKAPPHRVMAFAEHHLRLGASEILLFFDDAADPAADAVLAREGVRVFRCDRDHYQRLGAPDPDKLMRGSFHFRQDWNSQHGIEVCRTPWIAHLDSDEFLHPRGNLAGYLSTVPDAVDYVSVGPLELCFPADPKAGTLTFRRPFPVSFARRLISPLVWGRDWRMMRHGLMGHTMGKPIARTGRGLRLANHRAMAGETRAREKKAGRELELLHIFVSDLDDWRAKVASRARLSKVQPDGRPLKGEAVKQLRLHFDVDDADEVARLFRRFMTPSTYQKLILSMVRRLERYDLDGLDCIRQYLTDPADP